MWKDIVNTNFPTPTQLNSVNDLKKCLNAMIKHIYNLYQRYRYHWRINHKYKKQLIIYGMLKHGNVSRDPSDRSINRRLKHMSLCVDYHNSLVVDALDLREKYLLYDIKKNECMYDILMPKFELLFIKQQTKLNQLIGRDVDYGCALTMAGILNGWSNKTWDAINLHV